METRRRMMKMSGEKEPFVIFQNGNTSLSNGTISNNWCISNGMIVVSSGDGYHGKAYITGINFSGYKKLCFKVNVPEYNSYVGGGGDEIGIGYGPVGTSGSVDPDEWDGGKLYTSSGTFETELDISSVKEVCPINLVAAGISIDSTTGDYSYAILKVYDIWLE